jgi:hypothetical protein
LLNKKNNKYLTIFKSKLFNYICCFKDQSDLSQNRNEKENIDFNNIQPSCSKSLTESKEKFIDESELIDFDSDDFVKDPDYAYDNNSSKSSSSFENEIDKLGDKIEEFEQMGRQIEANLSNETFPEANNEKVKQDKEHVKWNRKTSKEKRNRGETYVNTKQQVVKARSFKPLSECRFKCKDKIPLFAQRELFETYWTLGSYNQRVLYISALIEIKNKKIQRLNKHPTNPRTRKYHFQYFVDYENVKVRVCQKCFRTCFDETESFLKSVANKKIGHPITSIKDNRGSDGSINKLPENRLNLIKAHINSFPAYESHYTRRDTTCKYFEAHLSVALMHRLYMEKYPSEIVSRTTYSQILKGK